MPIIVERKGGFNFLEWLKNLVKPTKPINTGKPPKTIEPPIKIEK